MNPNPPRQSSSIVTMGKFFAVSVDLALRRPVQIMLHSIQMPREPLRKRDTGEIQRLVEQQLVNGRKRIQRKR